MSGEKRTLGAAIFADIDSNDYLNKLYEKILYNYALHLLQLDQKKEPQTFDYVLQTCCPNQMILKKPVLIRYGRRKLLFC